MACTSPGLPGSHLQAHEISGDKGALQELLNKASVCLRPANKSAPGHSHAPAGPAVNKRALVPTLLVLLDHAGGLATTDEALRSVRRRRRCSHPLPLLCIIRESTYPTHTSQEP